MRFRMLGPLVVSGAEVTAGRERTVLAMLLLRPGSLVPARDLIDALWDVEPPATAKAQLQTAVSRLRRTLSADLIYTDPAGYGIRIPRHDLDALQFAEHVEQARALAGTDPERARVLIRAGLDLWRGPALAGLESRIVRQRAAALDEQHALAVEEWADLEIALGRDRAILGDLTALVEEFPLRERLRGQLLVALNNAGRQADALAEYRRARQLLIDELGIEPGEDLRRIHARILSGESTAPARAPVRSAPVPRELPPPPRSFTARARELAVLDGLLGDEVGTTVVISAVSGTAGVGKTTLAVHWGHRAAGRFPDGQLYVNLRGHDPGGAVLDPDEALREFLTALDVPPQKIPAGRDARSALFRSTVAGRRLLIVLDNAGDAEQVRPLLPASPGCMTVVTSRAQLTGLAVTSGAYLINLDLLSFAEARQLLAGRLGEHRLAAEPAAADRIIGACGHLPLALAIAAARALSRPDWTLEKLAGELDAARLDTLATGDPASDARAVFSWSYRALTPAAATLFRLLGRYPGPDFGELSVTSLLGGPATEALAELVRAQLVAVRRDDGAEGGRYGLHDLLRDYARELTAREDPAEVRDAALARLYSCFLHNGQDAQAITFPQRLTFERLPPDPAVPLVPITGRDSAGTWYTAERESLIAAAQQAADVGRDGDAWRLADTVAPLLIRSGSRELYAAVVTRGLAAAERAGDPAGIALMTGNHAMSRVLLGDLEAGVTGMRRVAELFAAAGDQRGVGFAELELGTFMSRAGDPGAASAHATRSLEAFRAAGDQAGQGKALNNLGWYRYRLGDLAAAATYGEQALAIQRAERFQRGQADVLDTLGVVYHELGDIPRAIEYLTEAIVISMETDDQLGAADCLVHLGEVQTSAGEVAAARISYTQALAIYDQADHPDAAEVRQRLDQLGPGPSLPPPV